MINISVDLNKYDFLWFCAMPAVGAIILISCCVGASFELAHLMIFFFAITYAPCASVSMCIDCCRLNLDLCGSGCRTFLLIPAF